MKIQCGQCERKYKVPDEKVGGKAFKVRCRNCESTIIVRPDGRVSTRPPAGAGQPEESFSQPPSAGTSGQASMPPSSFSAGDEQADWHVVVDGDQQGPYAPVVLSEMLTVGTIDWDAYVWREGFDGWLPARDVPELVEAITGQPYDSSYASEDASGGAAAGGFAATTGDASLDADVDSAMDNVFGGGFGGGDAEAEESPFSPSVDHDSSSLGRSISDAPAAGASAGDFMDFGGGSSPPSSRRSSAAPRQSNPPSEPALFGMQGAPSSAQASDQTSPDGGGSMTGQRNENSVLFSLSNLQALAGEGGAQPAAAAQAGHATGDASGLIDIRALAGATGLTGGGGGGGAASGAKDDVDDLMSIGTGSALSANLAAPVLSAGEDESDNKKWIIMAAALAGAIVLAAIILAVALGGGDEQVAVAPQPIPSATTATPAPPVAEPESVAEPDREEEAKAEDEAEQDEEDEADEGNDSSGSSSARRRSRSRRSPSRSSSSGSSAPEPKPEPKQERSRNSIDDLLDNATGGGGSRKSSSSSSGESSANLPSSPSKSQVVSAMNSVAGKVKACGQGQSGVAMVSVSVSGSTGRVKGATVSGSFQGTPVGSCVARAVRSAKFPKFKQSTFTVKYPFRI